MSALKFYIEAVRSTRTGTPAEWLVDVSGDDIVVSDVTAGAAPAVVARVPIDCAQSLVQAITKMRILALTPCVGAMYAHCQQYPAPRRARCVRWLRGSGGNRRCRYDFGVPAARFKGRCDSMGAAWRAFHQEHP